MNAPPAAVSKPLPYQHAGRGAVAKASAWLEIHLGNLIHNLGVAKRLAGPDVGILAVIKANAYGHGIEMTASALAPHVSMFGVTRLSEALRLREYGIETPVLLLGPIPGDEIQTAVKSRCVITVSSLAEARTIELEAAKLGRPALIHVKVDTGMGRLGISWRRAAGEIRAISRLRHLRLEGLYTHFPKADQANDLDFSRAQIERFHTIRTSLESDGVQPSAVHLSNSAGLASLGPAGGNFVRPGLMLYGALSESIPVRKVRRLDLLPVLAWRTRVILIKELFRGETCGYAGSHKAKCRTRVAWIPVGYSHGYPLSLSSRARVLIRGQYYPVAGRISMDFTAIDIGARGEIKIGDPVTLIGQDGKKQITLNDVARWGGTIPYEIATCIHPSIPRVAAP